MYLPVYNQGFLRNIKISAIVLFTLEKKSDITLQPGIKNTENFFLT